MANAKQCDRCGAFYTEDITRPQYIIGKPTRAMNLMTGAFNSSTKILDICPECNASFISG